MPKKIRKILLWSAGLVVVVISLGVYRWAPRLGLSPGRVTAAVSQSRLVPEKVSRGAAISVAVPRAAGVNVAEQVSFNPRITGRWLAEADGQLISKNDTRAKTQIFYYQPGVALEVGQHYAAVVNAAADKIWREDFLVVADPEVMAILPADEEVLPETKISIIFNRPMIPLSRLDEYASDDLPVEIMPPTPGRFKWVSTNTLQFIPTDGLISSADYQVAVRSGLESMDGLAAKGKEARFSTYHLDFADGSESATNSNIVRGYNQPFIIRFNQAVDLERTKERVVITSGKDNVPFTATYLKENDLTAIALYPAGTLGRWEMNRPYLVRVEKAYPKSGGNITLDGPRNLNYQVGSFVENIRATSSRTPHSSIERFDPTGQLILRFYEDIDLEKSRIRGAEIAEIIYGEKCAETRNFRQNCAKVPNRQELLISFESGIKPDEKLKISLDNIVGDNGAALNTQPLTLTLQVYQPLVIHQITSGSSLGNLTVCSNNPLKNLSENGTTKRITAVPEFNHRYWGESYLVRKGDSRAPCASNQFATAIDGHLIGNQSYRLTADLEDVFGSQVSGNFSFTTRAVRVEDYQVSRHQDYEVTTVPSRTKLTFSAQHLPNITATVCRLRAYDYYRAKMASANDATPSCEATVSRLIPLSATHPDRMFFTIDIKDFYSQPIGNYLVTLSSPLLKKPDPYGYSPTKMFVSVTNLIVTEKKINPLEKSEYESLILTGDQLSRLQNLYWVLDARTQAPVAGATINLYRAGAIVGTSLTNAQGLAFLIPVVGSETAIVTWGNEAVIIADNSTALNWSSTAANVKRFYLYTDKPIYRPNQEVNLKGYYRLGYDGYYEVPVDQTVSLKIYDSANKVIKDATLKVNNFGAISTTIKLDPTAPLGDYRACVDYRCAYFEVLNYVPAAFQVMMETAHDEFTPNDEPQVKLRADYYFGVPVSGASVEYNTSSQYYHFDKYRGEYFNFNNLYQTDSNDNGDYYYGDRYLGHGEDVLNQAGETVITPELKADGGLDQNVSKIIILDATVKNQEGRSISSQKSFVQHAGLTYLGSKVEPSFTAVNQPVILKVKSVDLGGTPISVGGIQAEIYKVNWIGVERPLGLGRYDKVWREERELIRTENFRTNGNGDELISLNVAEEGEYQVEVKTAAGKAVGSRAWFYAYGPGGVTVRSQDDTNLTIKTEQTDLNPGQTGRVVMELPEGRAKALVTLERGKIFSYEIVDITGNIASYEFPVTAEHYPNIHLSVVAYSPDRAVRFGHKNFTVSSRQKELQINISSDKKTYLPDDTVNLRLQVTDDRGRPVAAELSVAVVDMSVLALRGNPKKEPVAQFYGQVPLTITTYSNYKNLLKYVEPLNADGKGGGGSDPNSHKRRGLFKEVAYWTPHLTTGETGQASVSFKLPDNLTTWQVEVVGMTTDTKVGAAYHEFLTKKQLMVNPLRPRFILPGDEFSLGAQIFNQSEAALSLAVTLKAPELTIDDNLTKNISIKARETKTVYWKVAVPETSSPKMLKYSVTAAAGHLLDTVDDELPVKPNTLSEVTATAGETSSQASEAVFVPETILQGQGELTIESSATLALHLPNARHYFLNYPYDSTREISKKLRALALINDALSLPSDNPKNDLDALYARQNQDGGFRFWTEGEYSNPDATMEAMETFAVLNRLGQTIDNQVWEKAADYLFAKYLEPGLIYSDAEKLEFISALFARTKERQNAELQRELTRIANALIKDSKSSSRHLLTAALIMEHYELLPNLSEKIERVLRNRLVIDSRGAFLDVGREKNYFYFETATDNTARYLELLALRRANNSELSNMWRWLGSARDKDGVWGSTRYTLSVVSAITSYLKWQPELQTNFTLETRVNDQTIEHFTFEPKNIFTQLKQTLPLAKLRVGEINTVTWRKANAADQGKIYYGLAFKYFLPAAAAEPRDEGFAIRRDFFALDDEKNEEPLSAAAVGEVLRARLEIIVPVTRRNVAIEDFIPAGLEIIDTTLATERQSIRRARGRIKSQYLWPTHQEWRDDRAFLFTEELDPGTYEFNYLVRVLAPGNYLHLPAQIFEMDNSENFGRSAATYFTVK